jgi:hypothetical protein
MRKKLEIFALLGTLTAGTRGKVSLAVEKSLKSGARNFPVAFYLCHHRESQLKGFS